MTPPWCCAPTIGPGPIPANPSPGDNAEGEWGVGASVGAWIEPLLPNVGACEVSNAFAIPRLAFVGRVLPGLRFGSSNRLIFGSKYLFGLRTAFCWGPVGLEGGGFFAGSVVLVLEGANMEKTGEFGAPGREGRIGAGEEGAENRDDGEAWV
jgi:hypothetical protein